MEDQNTNPTTATLSQHQPAELDVIIRGTDIKTTHVNEGNNHEERVKVDRKRFEQMLGENTTIGCDADSFFRRVMRSTNTQIMWPPKLKPGTKSKKDPHVRITGSPNSISAAKEIIFEQLDTRRNRVTLKMDVAFTDHSHIIGKGGRSIQRVMDETGCHIHFPDSNRTNMAEKSNQVSIAGSAEGVEQSRRRIREMLPITLQFDLPLNNGLHSPPTLDPQSPQLQAIQQSYGITITFRCDSSKCNNNSYFASSRIITVAVRGARSHLFGLRQGLSILIEYLTGFRANTINVPLTMTIDVAMQHHAFIAGRANCNLRSIMQSTGAVIMMPDLDNNNQTISTSSSSLSSTAAAMIDHHQQQQHSSSMSQHLSASCGSLTSINELAASLSAVSGGGNSASSAAIAALAAPSSASLDDNNNDSMTSPQAPNHQQQSSFMNALTNASSKTNTNENNNSINHQTYPRGSLINSLGATHTLAAAPPTLSTSTLSLNSNSSSTHSTCGGISGAGGANRKTAIVIRGPNFDSVYNAWQELLGQLPLILIFDLKEGQDLDPVQVTRLMEQMRQISILIKPKQRQNTKSIVVRGPEKDSRLLFEVRKQILKLDDSELPHTELHQQQLKQQTKLTQQLTHQLIAQQQQIRQQQQQQQQHQQQQQQQQLVVGTSRQQLQSQHQHQPQQQSAELQMKAIRAMLDPNLRKARQPTPYWAGLGFSKSVSEPMIKEKLSVGPLFSSNLIDDRRTSYSNENALHDLATSLQSMQVSDQHVNSQKITDCLRLAVFLSKVGLVSYLGIFKSRGIDLEMLFSLTEADLAELGMPYVHRHKLAIAIADEKASIQNEQQRAALSALSSTFDAAPGAERSKRQKAGNGPGELNDIWSM